jgi:hypothetical protein
MESDEPDPITFRTYYLRLSAFIPLTSPRFSHEPIPHSRDTLRAHWARLETTKYMETVYYMQSFSNCVWFFKLRCEFKSVYMYRMSLTIFALHPVSRISKRCGRLLTVLFLTILIRGRLSQMCPHDSHVRILTATSLTAFCFAIPSFEYSTIVH